MEHARRLTGIWSYLPTFRFVAEEQHVGRAAKMLGLNPSSVSRAISDLETALGYRVFDRRGRALELNAQGQRLLEVVRAAMRRVDDGVSRDFTIAGRLRIGADEPFLSASLADLVAGLEEAHPEIVPVVHRFPSEALERLLLTGRIDLGFGLVTRSVRGLTCTKLYDLGTGLYAPATHPLAIRSRVAPAPLALGAPPPDAEVEIVEIEGVHGVALQALGVRARTVAVAEDVVMAIAICRARGAAAVLPDRLAQRLGDGGLVRLALETPPIPVSVVARDDMGGTPRVRAGMLAALRLSGSAEGGASRGP